MGYTIPDTVVITRINRKNISAKILVAESRATLADSQSQCRISESHRARSEDVSVAACYLGGYLGGMSAWRATNGDGSDPLQAHAGVLHRHDVVHR